MTLRNVSALAKCFFDCCRYLIFVSRIEYTSDRVGGIPKYASLFTRALPLFAGMIIRRAATGVAITFSEAVQISRGFTNQLYRALNERAEVRDENFRFVATETPRGSFDVSRLDAQFLALPVAQAARIQRIKVPPVSFPVFVQAGNLEVRTINTQTSSLSLRILLAREFHPRVTTWLVLALIRQKKKKKKTGKGKNLHNDSAYFLRRQANFHRDEYISMFPPPSPPSEGENPNERSNESPQDSPPGNLVWRGETVKLFTACIMTRSVVDRRECEKESLPLPPSPRSAPRANVTAQCDVSSRVKRALWFSRSSSPSPPPPPPRPLRPSCVPDVYWKRIYNDGNLIKAAWRSSPPANTRMNHVARRKSPAPGLQQVHAVKITTPVH